MRRTNHQLFFLFRVRSIYKNKQKWIDRKWKVKAIHRFFSKKFSLTALKVFPGHPEVNKVSIFDAVSVFLYLLKDWNNVIEGIKDAL